MCKILITGASGFVGAALCARLLRNGHSVKGTLLTSELPISLPTGVQPVVVEHLSNNSCWDHAVTDVDIIIHLAARVHVMKETAVDPVQEFRKVNLYGTEQLAQQAAQAGVNRFVFMSTVGVNGDNSGQKPYYEGDEPHPHNPYSVSKYEAELTLEHISGKTGMEVVMVRAPIVYGPGNPGNFLSLLKVIHRRTPLPLASIQNKRSLIYVENLVDALAVCATHPDAAGQTYLVSDGEDVSTSELIRRTAAALGIRARLLPFPVSVMRLIGKLTGRSATVNRLTGSLAVDSSKIIRELGWKPPFTMEEGLQATAQWFKQTCR